MSGVALLLWSLSAPARAAMPVETALKVLVRVLSYDRSISQRSHPAQPSDQKLRFGVIYDPSDALSVEQSAAALDTLADLEGSRVGALEVGSAASISIRNVRWDLVLDGITAVIVCRGTEEVYAALTNAAASKGIATLTLDAAGVGRGMAVGVEQRQARLQIIVDRARAAEQGLDLSPELLELAEIR